MIVVLILLKKLLGSENLLIDDLFKRFFVVINYIERIEVFKEVFFVILL